MLLYILTSKNERSCVILVVPYVKNMNTKNQFRNRSSIKQEHRSAYYLIFFFVEWKKIKIYMFFFKP